MPKALYSSYIAIPESKILANHKGTVPKATMPMAIKSTMIPLISLVINIIFHRIFFPFYCSLL